MSSSSSPFGQNEWLVEEMYRKFREDPSSVDSSWHEFLVDYSPEPVDDTAAWIGTGHPRRDSRTVARCGASPSGQARFARQDPDKEGRFHGP